MRCNKLIALSFCVLFLASSHASAKKVLFYEIDVPKEYTKDDGYTKLRDKLVNMGYDIAAITQGSLTRDTIETYDILIIHASQQLSTEEVATIVWFVSSEGGGILIAGGEPEYANRLMPIFGMTMDEGTLIDFTDAIKTAGKKKNNRWKENSHFEVSRFTSDNITRFIRLGVNTIGFYEGSGLILSGDAKWVARGDADTYSDTLSFPSGSQPPVAAASIFGNGLAVGIGDADILTNDYIDEYDNMQFISNAIDWLSTSKAPTTLNASKVEIEVIINQCNLERTRLESDKESCGAQVQSLSSTNDLITNELSTCTLELEDITKGKIGPFTRTQLAIIIAGLLAFIGGIVMSGKKRIGGGESAREGEDILSELGYEFEGAEESSTDEGDGVEDLSGL